MIEVKAGRGKYSNLDILLNVPEPLEISDLEITSSKGDSNIIEAFLYAVTFGVFGSYRGTRDKLGKFGKETSYIDPCNRSRIITRLRNKDPQIPHILTTERQLLVSFHKQSHEPVAISVGGGFCT